MILSRPRVLGAAVVLAALPVVAAPAAAQAAGGATTIQLKGPAAKALTAHVKITARKPARASARSLSLPVSGGTVATGALLRNSGSVILRAGRRTATLTSWQTRVTASGSKVSAKLAGRRVTFFAISAPKRRIAVDKATKAASLAGGSAKLTPAGAKALRTRLALRALRPGAFGSAKVTAKLGASGGSGGGGTTTPGGGTTTPGGGGTTNPTPGGGTTTPPPARCEGFGVGDVPTAPAPQQAPAGAFSVTAAPMTWYARDTWVQYLATAEGMVISDGALPGARESYPGKPDSTPLVYSAIFTFKPAGSWYQPAGAATKGQLNYTGTVRFSYASHGIDLTFRDPEIVFDGSSARIVFTVSGGSCSNLGAKRVTIVDLAAGAPSGAGPFSYGQLDGTLASAGAGVFSNMYGVGKEWGMVRDLTVTTGPAL